MGDDERAIRELVSSWLEATKRGDVDSVLGLMTEDVVFLVPGRSPMNKTEFATLSRTPPDRIPPQIDGKSDIREIQVCGDWAFMWSELTIQITPQPKSPTMQRHGHTLTILRKVQGRWLLARDANLLTTITSPSKNEPSDVPS